MSTIKIPSHVNTKKARVRKSESSDWNWEDEMLMYDVSNRSSEVKKLRREKEEKSLKTKEEEDEVKRIAKEKETELLYMREERKLFLGGLAPETIEKDLRKHFHNLGN
ncbi:unnamed protein product [Lepeophtheirus salmonis]|uniref:(salmon louse) hypothetical protein n=1 Tax=Lepeophtheirus salmonis TaxID=72036 RepID=A0A7R8D0J1_LEPSM|nr:unnamed protein product [Lepeophtheirus salmonis]CAF2959251.1 unnamed protein product [Lepeophtheirus salmonis]